MEEIEELAIEDELEEPEELAIEDEMEEIEELAIEDEIEEDEELAIEDEMEEIEELAIEDYEPKYTFGTFQNMQVQKYTDDLNPLLDKFNVSKIAIAENENGLFEFNHNDFDIPLSIDIRDPLFKEVLAQGKVLSLSGELTESEYLETLFSNEVLNSFRELFVRPIMDDNEVKGIVILARENEQEELSHEERKELFIDHS